MSEYIKKWPVVNKLIDIENEFQRHKPFRGFEHAIYLKVCEAEAAIGKTPPDDVTPVVRCKDCKYFINERKRCDHPNLDYDVECYDHWIGVNPDDFCSYGEREED